MCGRARLSELSHEQLRSFARLHRPSSSAHDESESLCCSLPVIENLSPGMDAPVVVCDAEQPRCFLVQSMRWGLIAHYAQGEKADHFALFNKRIESLDPAHSGYFARLVLRGQRCVVALDGFYEWTAALRGDADKHKQPFYAHSRAGEALLVAAIFEDSFLRDPLTGERSTVRTFSILTGPPSRRFKALHDRQPVLLTREQALQWLDPHCSLPSLSALLAALTRNPLDDTLKINAELVWHAVSRKMTDAHYQGEDCARPVTAALSAAGTAQDKESSRSPAGKKRTIDRYFSRSSKAHKEMKHDKAESKTETETETEKDSAEPKTKKHRTNQATNESKESS